MIEKNISTIDNSLQLFQNTNWKVRVVMLDGEPWFVAKDVCECLELGNPSQAIARLEDDERCLISNEALRANGETAVVSEPGLYSLVLGSRKPDAKAFKRWVTHEVLPSIRKTGSYSVSHQQTRVIPKTFPEALRAYADEVERREAAEKRALTAESELSYEKEAHEKDNEDFKAGLDILNSQKAQISSKREATAMATASSARAHQHFAEKVLESHASELISLRAAMEERRSHLWDANRTAHAIYRLNVLKKEYSLDTLQNKARCLLSHFATKLGKPSIPLPNGATYTDPFGRLQTAVSTYYERDVVDAVLDWVVENPNDFARLGGKRDPLTDEW